MLLQWVVCEGQEQLNSIAKMGSNIIRLQQWDFMCLYCICSLQYICDTEDI